MMLWLKEVGGGLAEQTTVEGLMGEAKIGQIGQICFNVLFTLTLGGPGVENLFRAATVHMMKTHIRLREDFAKRLDYASTSR